MPIRYYKDQCHEHMIRNVMWDVFSFLDPHNKENIWGIIINQSRSPLEYPKRYLQSLHKGSEADKYVVQNLTWSGVYLRSNLSNTILQKLLTLVPLTATGPGVFVTTIATLISDSHDTLKETLNHMKNLKLKIYSRENVIYFCAEILVDDERL